MSQGMEKTQGNFCEERSLPSGLFSKQETCDFSHFPLCFLHRRLWRGDHLLQAQLAVLWACFISQMAEYCSCSLAKLQHTFFYFTLKLQKGAGKKQSCFFLRMDFHQLSSSFLTRLIHEPFPVTAPIPHPSPNPAPLVPFVIMEQFQPAQDSLVLKTKRKSATLSKRFFR